MNFKITKKHIFIYIFILIGVLVIDLVSKSYIASHYNVWESKTIIPGFFSITYAQNKGAAWGILEGQQTFFLIIAIICAIGIIYYFIHTKEKQTLLRLGLVLIMAGLLGNVYDRVLLGYVRDFLDFIIFGYDYPIFNVADMGVVIGMCFVILDTVLGEYKQWKFNRLQRQ